LRAHAGETRGRAPGIVGLGGDVRHVPQPPLAGVGPAEPAFEIGRVAHLHDVSLDAEESAASAVYLLKSRYPLTGRYTR